MAREPAFEKDDFPKQSKILFIGLAQSSHTHSWINLLHDAPFNLRLFAAPPSSMPPDDWIVPTYLSMLYPPQNPDKRYRCFLYPNSLLFNHLNAHHPLFPTVEILQKAYNKMIQNIKSPEAWLAEIINTWQPDIIHTLGMDHNQGGFFFNEVRKKYPLNKTWKWVVQTRGGSDLELNRFDPAKVVQIKEIFETCDRIISDNTVNIEYASQMGISREKFTPLTPVPGTGGIDVDSFVAARQTPPSQRERIILWPKAYDCQWSLALPVFEALKNCWAQIQPCKIYMLAMDTPSTRDWSRSLPPEILQNCIIQNRLPRQEALDLMARARVLLIPSLVDGVPNSLYEAMSAGTFPIVSPLNTLQTCVGQPHNVLFARNLYPAEIAQALIRAMSDDALVDAAAQNNLEKVRQIADREIVQKRVVAFYQSLL